MLCTLPGCGPGESVALCLNNYSRLQTNCEVFKWVPSITALTTDMWLANLELILHTHTHTRAVSGTAPTQPKGFILNLGTLINFHLEHAHCEVHAL